MAVEAFAVEEKGVLLADTIRASIADAKMAAVHRVKWERHRWQYLSNHFDWRIVPVEVRQIAARPAPPPPRPRPPAPRPAPGPTAAGGPGPRAGRRARPGRRRGRPRDPARPAPLTVRTDRPPPSSPDRRGGLAVVPAEPEQELALLEGLERLFNVVRGRPALSPRVLEGYLRLRLDPLSRVEFPPRCQ